MAGMARNQLIPLLLLLTGLILTGKAAAEPFVPDDQIISDPGVSLVDPEIDQINHRIVWQTLAGKLWVAALDPDTGDLVPANGMGELVDIDLAPLQLTLNGPEWAHGLEGTWIVYTKSTGIGFSLAAARQDRAGVWHAGVLVNSFLRLVPLGTPSSNMQVARTTYFIFDPRSKDLFLVWRNLLNQASEDILLDSTVTSGRWIEGLPMLVTTALRDGYRQIVTYDIESKQLEQLTFDASNKFLPYMWLAPEFGEILLMTMLDTTAIGIYQQDGSAWSLLYSITLPTTKPFVHSPEPFVYGGKSYILLVAADQLGSGGSFPGMPVGPTEIWVAGIDHLQPFFRRIDDPGYDANRLDPEIYITTNDAVAVYTENNEITRRFLLKRASTGLATNPY